MAPPMPPKMGAKMMDAPGMLNLDSLARFVDPLPIPPITKPAGQKPSPANPAVQVPFYRLAMRPISSKIHRDLQPTKFWALGDTFPGPTLETRSGQPIIVEWVNQLPPSHFLPIDHAVHGAESDKPDVRSVIHLHGAKVPPESDGYPEQWFVPGKSATTYYPNGQDATMLWYHDHTLGINRLNVYAGLLGQYFIRDNFEDSLHLPKGKYEVPLVLVDRFFDEHGQLYYPVSPDPEAPWVPEVFGDAILVNGKLFPYLEVEPRKYRFRILNAANSRFFHLRLSTGGQSLQIGTDQGLLPSPVPLKTLTVGPGERCDIIVDFAEMAGEQILLQDNPLVAMQFRVQKTKVQDDSVLPSTLRQVEKLSETLAVTTRSLTLGEMDDRAGNPMRMLLNNAHWSMPVTETPKLNSVEIWEFLNLTDDSHPIHLHLVRFQILDRRPWDAETYATQGVIRYLGDALPPGPEEAGWKDTVRADPGMITRIIVPFEGFVGRYVWHCHILEHEDSEMMRPYDVLP